MATEDEYKGCRACSAYFDTPKPGTAAHSGLCWPKDKKELKVYFEVTGELPTWPLKDKKRYIGPGIILNWANLWSKDKPSVPRFIETEHKGSSDIRVLLSGERLIPKAALLESVCISKLGYEFELV